MLEPHLFTTFHPLQRIQTLMDAAQELQKTDASMFGTVRLDLGTSLRELAAGSLQVSVLKMIVAHRHLNQALQKSPIIPAIPMPEVFENIMRLEKAAPVKLPNPPLKLLIHSESSIANRELKNKALAFHLRSRYT